LTTNYPWRNIVPDAKTALGILTAFIKKSLEALKMVKQQFPDYFGHVDESLYAKVIFDDSESAQINNL